LDVINIPVTEAVFAGDISHELPNVIEIFELGGKLD
jgi:hypothetical protein